MTGVQTCALPISFVILGFMTNSLYGVLAGKASSRLASRSSYFQEAGQYVSGTVLMTLGVISALTPTPTLR